MKRQRLPMFILAVGLVAAMAQSKAAFAQSGTDTLAPQVTNLGDKLSGLEERITNAEIDLSKLTKIKLSGYIQAQYQHFEQSSVYPANNFLVRRARFKLTYEPANGLVFALEPDFAPGNLSIKNAYAMVNEPWLKTFSIWAGKFDRPDYEVEYSSSNLEALERSRVITTLYPDEKAIGFKLEMAPPKTHLKIQLALLNGNEGYTYTDALGNTINAAQNNLDFDNFKDLMGRVTYAFKLGNFGGLTIGAHGYYGKVKANSNDLLNSDYTYNKAESNIGNSIRRNWVGGEMQFYADILGGLSVKAEYITGVNGTPGYTGSTSVVSPTVFGSRNDTLTFTNITTNTSALKPAIERNFMGYYVYLIKNIGKRNQFAIRYDYYDPNTKLGKDSIGISHYYGNSSTTKSVNSYAGTTPVTETINQTVSKVSNSVTSGTGDIAYGTWTLAWTYFFDDNIKFQLGYSIPMNEKVTNKGKVTQSYTVNNVPSKYDFNNLISQNILTFRIQVKF